MNDEIRIQLMGNFGIYVNGRKCDQLIQKSRKGLALIEFLILKRGQSVPNYRLLSNFWPNEDSNNPENALKTLISRLRVMLNQIYAGMGGCIVSDRGAYHWDSLPNMSVDVFEVEELLAQLKDASELTDENRSAFNRLIKIYTGDLLQNCDKNDWALGRATVLHNQYMDVVCNFINLFKNSDEYGEIVNTCRAALEVDYYDDHLQMELMAALVKTDRTSEAMVQYKHAMYTHYRYMGTERNENMQEFYDQIVHAGKTLELNLESIRSELRERGEQRGAFICDYNVFKEIYNLQIRNLERLGSTMFLAVIMISNINSEVLNGRRQEDMMSGLMEVLRQNLRKGDTVTRFSSSVVALLLPTVNYSTGNMVMERVKRVFYQQFPDSNIAFNYRVGPLSSDTQLPNE